MICKVKLLHPDAKVPTKAYIHDAGFDLYSVEDVDIKPGETVKVHTGVSISPPSKYNVSLIWDRSSLGSKGIHRLAGVIDSSYTGELLVCLTNLNIYPLFSSLLSDYSEHFMLNTGDLFDMKANLNAVIKYNTYSIKKGDKIAQLVIQEFVPCQLEVVDSLELTDRGEKGFGSSN